MLSFKLAACYSPGMSLRRGWWPWIAPEVFRDPARISEKVGRWHWVLVQGQCKGGV